MVFMVAISSIHFLREKADEISVAQKLRGFSPKGSIFDRIKSINVVVIPLLICSIRYSTEVGATLELKGFSSKKRMNYFTLHLSTLDKFLCLLAMSIMVSVVIL